MLGLPFLVLATGANTPVVQPESLGTVPARVLDAYRAADGACPGLRWQLLAGIGWVESRHGTVGGGVIDAETGEVRPWILGPPLDGSGGLPIIRVGRWQGWWGLEGPFEQAVGPMQFRAPTFTSWAVDADDDGTANPHDVDDAVATAAAYLCGAAGGAIDTGVDGERRALRRYNAGSDYADEVLEYAAALEGTLIVASGAWACPIAGPTSFTDTWGAPRSGGRQHRGVDMFARMGTPVVAPVGGVVEHSEDRLGGLSFRLWGTDGHFYFGTHLAGYGPLKGEVRAGTVVGYVGSTGNAAGTGSHLHFEIHPSRRRGDPPSAVNPTPTVEAHCGRQRVGVVLSGGT